MINNQLTVHTELELPTISEMVLHAPMVTSEERLTMSQTHKVDQRKIQNVPGQSQLFQDMLLDITSLIQIPTMSSQEVSGKKSLVKPIESILSPT